MEAVTPKRVIYHVGDIVRIVEPAVFVRVGYPLTRGRALEVTAKEYDERIYAFMREVYPSPADFTVHESDSRLYSDLVDALASYWLRQNNYGGKERKIYTEVDESIRGTGGWRVASKRIVKTGTYSRGGYCGGGWNDEPDYQPPYLANERSHVLLMLESSDLRLGQSRGPVEIEAVNVEPQVEREAVRG